MLIMKNVFFILGNISREVNILFLFSSVSPPCSTYHTTCRPSPTTPLPSQQTVFMNRILTRGTRHQFPILPPHLL
ncbi:hypothetical protein HanRHA438_Chr08g0371151 [Helianthus annuus]|nr:hypothetical protein HanRHA438_Chr08g0371151 [Helianthus annuus]